MSHFVSSLDFFRSKRLLTGRVFPGQPECVLLDVRRDRDPVEVGRPQPLHLPHREGHAQEPAYPLPHYCGGEGLFVL